MKTHNPMLLVFAMATALSLAACTRDENPAVADPEATPPVVEPAPMPAEPMPAEPAPPAATAPAPMDSGMSFAQMDKNADGGITLDELDASEMLHQHFSAADTDSDGKLSEAEVEKHRADMAATPSS